VSPSTLALAPMSESLTMAEINIFKHARDTQALQPGDVLFREGDQAT
jgi:hypothetical protein